MKALAVLAACVALCTSSAIPEIPGDNSHYVEGVSRYIWMPDGEGVPHLVDLEEEDTGRQGDVTRRGAKNEYLLYTRLNPDVPQVLVDGNTDSIENSNFVRGNAIKVVVHGYNNNRNSDVCTTVTKAFLAAGDSNVIVLEWRSVANSNYLTASNGVVSVGKYLGNFLVWLVEQTGSSWDDVHLVGYSLGAHVVGNAGRTAGGRIARITGLDPAGPRFGNNRNALNKDDAVYVEAIHTDGGRLGIFDSIADADFYPNGGRNPQPGCWISTCSHGRSYELFASTVRFNHLEGKQCLTTDDAQKVSCDGPTLPMGNTDLSKRGSGIYALLTSRAYPFEL